ncbi:MAG: DUF4255 domain-containing protein [Elainellaceae cyanobacterium]
MSNHLAIATVTAALQKILQEGIGRDVPGAQVTTVRPDATSSNLSGASVNIYMYQATPNPAWRNADLRSRRPKGDLIKQGQAGLDLHYLMTFYGNEQELEPQRLLGSVVRTLVDTPLLTLELINETLTSSTLPNLANSTLGDQVQMVKFLPSTITTEDLSRIWSVFFQVPYSLSFAYQATAVLIQGDKSGKTALPVRRSQFFVAPGRPVLERVEPEGEKGQPITLQSVLLIYGRQLRGSDRTLIQIGSARVTPQEISDSLVRINLAALPPQEQQLLRAGLQGVQVVHLSCAPGEAFEHIVESNAVPVVLCPNVLKDASPEIMQAEEDEDGFIAAELAVPVDITVAPGQRVFVLLNGTSSDNPNSYIFPADKRSADTSRLGFNTEGVIPGEYLVRVQIDGAESPLEVNLDKTSPEYQQYTGQPAIAIP